jgi:hypothetical protein
MIPKDQNENKPENRPQAFDEMLKPKDQNNSERDKPQAYDIDNMKPQVDENNKVAPYNNLDSNNPEPAPRVPPIPAPVQAPPVQAQRGGTRRKRSSRKTKKHVNKCHYCKREQEDLGLPVH